MNDEDKIQEVVAKLDNTCFWCKGEPTPMHELGISQLCSVHLKQLAARYRKDRLRVYHHQDYTIIRKLLKERKQLK